MPPPARSDRKATLLPSGENDGSMSSAGSLVNRTGSPPATWRTQMSRLPSPARSDANAMNRPSGDSTGSVVRPESSVNRVSTEERAGADGFSHHQASAAV